MREHLRQHGVGYLIAVAGTAVVAAIRFALSDVLGERAPFIPFVIPVMLAGWYGGVAPGLVATVLSGLLSNYLFAPPLYSLWIEHPSDAAAIAIFLVCGVTISWLCESLHIARRRLTEQHASLQGSEEFHRLISDLTSDFTWVARVQPDGTAAMDTVTEGFTKLLDYSQDELRASGWRSIVHPDDRLQAQEVTQRLLAGQMMKGEMRHVAKDGRIVWLRYLSRPVRDQHGRVIRLVGAARDISEQKRAERRLAVQHAVTLVLAESTTLEQSVPKVLRAIADCLGWEVGALWLVDADAHLLRCAEFWSHPSVRVGEFETLTRQRTFEPGIGLPGRVWSSRQSAWIPDVVPDANFPRAATASKVGLHGAFGFPILLGAEVLGVVEFFSREIQQPDEDILRLMASTGGQLGQFISRKRAEQTLREREQRFARFTEHLPGLAWIKDLEGRYVYANAAAATVFGISLTDLYGKTDDEIFPPQTAAQFKANDRHALESGAGVQVIETLEHPDGIVHYSIVSKFSIPGPDGQPVLVGGMAIDITQRKQAEEALRQSEARKAAVLNTALDAIITIDHEGKVVEFNPAAERLFGYAAAEVLRQNVKVLMPEPYYSHHDEYIGNYLRSGQAKIIGIGREVVGRRKDGSTFPMDLAVGEFQLEQRRYFTGIVRDITDRKQAEADLREADRRKDEFLATLAHELRNPLAPIRSAVEVLKKSGPLDPDSVSVREIIDRQVQQMARLLDDLLDVSRITRNRLELRKERVELAAVVQCAVETSRPLIDGKGHTLTVALPREQVHLDADPVRLAQVFSNLLNNAAKYTDPGGHIHLTAQRQGSEVVVAVKDNGIGIVAEVLPRLFEIFSQATPALERSQGGLGIGLSLVRGLAELHGGTIEAHSDGPGRGSEFMVRLPLVVGGPPPKPWVQGSFGELKSVSNCRLLVVDDNRDAADTLAKMLRIMGNEVHTAYDGEEAVKAAESFRPEIILLDIGMPRLNGHEVARRIRQKPWGQNLVLIALTGWGQDADRRRTEESGFDHHLVKPVELNALVQLLAASQPTEA